MVSGLYTLRLPGVAVESGAFRGAAVDMEVTWTCSALCDAGPLTGSLEDDVLALEGWRQDGMRVGIDVTLAPIGASGVPESPRGSRRSLAEYGLDGSLPASPNAKRERSEVGKVLLKAGLQETQIRSTEASLAEHGATSLTGLTQVSTKGLRGSGLSLVEAGRVLAHAEEALKEALSSRTLRKKAAKGGTTQPLAATLLHAAMNAHRTTAKGLLASRAFRALSGYAVLKRFERKTPTTAEQGVTTTPLSTTLPTDEVKIAPIEGATPATPRSVLRTSVKEREGSTVGTPQYHTCSSDVGVADDVAAAAAARISHLERQRDELLSHAMCGGRELADRERALTHAEDSVLLRERRLATNELQSRKSIERADKHAGRIGSLKQENSALHEQIGHLQQHLAERQNLIGRQQAAMRRSKIDAKDATLTSAPSTTSPQRTPIPPRSPSPVRASLVDLSPEPEERREYTVSGTHKHLRSQNCPTYCAKRPLRQERAEKPRTEKVPIAVAAVKLMGGKLRRSYGGIAPAMKAIPTIEADIATAAGLSTFFAALGALHLLPPVLEAVQTQGPDRYTVSSLQTLLEDAQPKPKSEKKKQEN